jgi:hypothetical protein
MYSVQSTIHYYEATRNLLGLFEENEMSFAPTTRSNPLEILDEDDPVEFNNVAVETLYDVLEHSLSAVISFTRIQ